MIVDDNVKLKETLREIDLAQYRPDIKKSLLYLTVDLLLFCLLLFGTYIAVTNEHYFLSFILSLLFGNIFFSLFVLGHDCGHGSFSRNKTTNNIVGFVLHQFLLTPYWAWKKSHEKHHRFAGNIEKDESFVPFTKDDAESFLKVKADSNKTFLRVRIFNLITLFSGLNFHIYTIYNPRTKCSHYVPNTVFFNKNDGRWVFLGAIFTVVYFTSLVVLTINLPTVMLFVYWLPLLACFHILSFVTLMQHHHDESNWYYTRDWDRLKGTLNTFDYRYGVLNYIISKLHHNIANFHLVHHIFSSIPHYNLEAATNELVGRSKSDYKPKSFSYSDYIKIIWSCNYVDNKNPDQKAYSLRPFEDL